jgi:putative transposase
VTRPKHRTQPGATYFITTNTWQRRALFQNPNTASIVEAAIFRYRDAGHYHLHRYVVMPDHIHLILTPAQSTSLEKAVQLVKGGSSHEIGSRFPVWRVGFTEHQIRDRSDFDLHVRYVDDNPVKAGLAATPAEYPHGTATGKFALDPWPLASGAKAPSEAATVSAGLKPRPSEAGISESVRHSQTKNPNAEAH